jgi:hypothetical protein
MEQEAVEEEITDERGSARIHNSAPTGVAVNSQGREPLEEE